MNQNQWEKLDELFHAALERESEARGLFVAEACAGDEGPRRELESMLAHHGQANSFIETPAYALEVETVVGDEHGNDASQSLIGKTLGSYKVLNKLGQGGNGRGLSRV